MAEPGFTLQGHRGTARHVATSQALNRGRCSFSLPGWWGQCLPLGGVFPPGGTPKALPSHNKEGKTSYMMKDASIRALLSTPASTSSGARSSTGQQSKAVRAAEHNPTALELRQKLPRCQGR